MSSTTFSSSGPDELVHAVVGPDVPFVGGYTWRGFTDDADRDGVFLDVLGPYGAGRGADYHELRTRIPLPVWRRIVEDWVKAEWLKLQEASR